MPGFRSPGMNMVPAADIIIIIIALSFLRQAAFVMG